jgi:hypothetical protein
MKTLHIGKESEFAYPSIPNKHLTQMGRSENIAILTIPLDLGAAGLFPALDDP